MFGWIVIKHQTFASTTCEYNVSVMSVEVYAARWKVKTLNFKNRDWPFLFESLVFIMKLESPVRANHAETVSISKWYSSATWNATKKYILWKERGWHDLNALFWVA